MGTYFLSHASWYFIPWVSPYFEQWWPIFYSVYMMKLSLNRHGYLKINITFFYKISGHNKTGDCDTEWKILSTLLSQIDTNRLLSMWYLRLVKGRRHIHETTNVYIDIGFNTLRPRQNEQHFADDIFKRIFFNENVWIAIKIPLKFVRKGPINNIPALVQIMAWRRSGDKPLS